METEQLKPTTAAELKQSESSGTDIPERKREVSWPSTLFYIHLHILGLYGIYVMCASASWLTIIFSKCERKKERERERNMEDIQKK